MKTTKVEALRKKYATENISIVDLVRMFDPTKNRLLTQMMTEELIATMRKSERRYEFSDHIKRHLHLDGKEKEFDAITHSPLLCQLVEQTLYLLGDENIYFVNQFKKYWDEGKIDHDLYSYKTLDDVKNAVHTLEMKEFSKSDAVKIHKVFEDDEWLLILPLSLKASQLYGAGTKWCTTHRDQLYHFFNHSRDGLLVYIINKKDNRKYAYQKLTQQVNEPGNRMSQFYTAADACIDSVDLDIPDYIMSELKNFVKTTEHPTNKEYPDFRMKDWDDYMTSQTLSEAAVPAHDAPALREEERPMEHPPVDAPARGVLFDIMNEPMEELEMPLKMSNIQLMARIEGHANQDTPQRD